MPKKYIVDLTEVEQKLLKKLTTTGKHAAYKINHARILLKADVNQPDRGWSDRAISKALNISTSTIERVRQRFVESGIDAALSYRQGRGRKQRRLDGEQEAYLLAVACSEAPQGRERWTLRMLADKMVELNHVESVSHETVRQTLKKNEIKPWQKKCWVIPPQQSAEFVCHMESVLEVYQRSYHHDFPFVCLDEAMKQLVKETKTPIPAESGTPERFDYQYERNGTANLFMLCNPIEGWRTVEVTKQRTAIDYAHLLKKLVDDYYPEAYLITVVQDNLNTHTPASLYKAFEPAEARRIMNRLEFCYTPKHGSWLNMAEIELSVLSRQCLNRRIPEITTLKEEVTAWCDERNRKETWIDWRFTTEDAPYQTQATLPLN